MPEKKLQSFSEVCIVGGGLAGLITSILLARNGIGCQLIEKKKYPFHRVCGEYLSNETLPFLKAHNLFPEQFAPPVMRRLSLSSVLGKEVFLPLDSGGFGISRFAFDHYLSTIAEAEGVVLLEEAEVDGVAFTDDHFHISSSVGQTHAQVVVASYGKRSRLDIKLGRPFIKKRSPYLGVKYHVRTAHPDDLISLHNFPGGYCGVGKVENGVTNICYLTIASNLKAFKSIREMEENILFKNPKIEALFHASEFLLPKPETINEISFARKAPVESHMLMVGDAAGMITPLCGNGMAMAIHAGKLAAERIISYFQDKSRSRIRLEEEYASAWNNTFATRMWVGRKIQNLFGNVASSNLAVQLANIPWVAKQLIRMTHGKEF